MGNHARVIVIIVRGRFGSGKEKMMTELDFEDLISRKALLSALMQLVNDLPPAFPKERPGPKSTNAEDVEAWEHEQGIRPWRDRHHL